MKCNERVFFRLIKMPCCGHLLCWVNPRLPTYCPECGKLMFTELKFDGTAFLVRDQDAKLSYETGG